MLSRLSFLPLDYKYRLHVDNEVEVSVAVLRSRAIGPRYDKAVETDTELYKLLLTCTFSPLASCIMPI